MLENLIPTLTSEDAEKLDPYVENRTYQRGSIMFEQFSDPQGLYILLFGHVRLFQLTVLARKLCAIQLMDLHAPDVQLLGEEALLLERLHASTAVAVTESEICFIPNEVFEQLQEEHPQVALRVTQFMAKTAAFRMVQLREKFENKLIDGAFNVQSALTMLRRYYGNTQICTPTVAHKLFSLQSATM